MRLGNYIWLALFHEKGVVEEHEDIDILADVEAAVCL